MSDNIEILGKMRLNKFDGQIRKRITTEKNYDNVKRSFDFIFAFILSIISLPLFVLIFIAIKISSMGPVIYTQKRVGEKNVPFILYKFRTMNINGNGHLWTDTNDNRITSLGKILRRTHLDELPQLLNIIKNDMSFIGPRPERLELVKVYRDITNYDLRHTIKPGLSGLAQLHYKPSTSKKEAEEKLKYDIYYIKNKSFTLDFLILLKTLGYWISGKL